LEQATLAVGRLDSISTLLDPHLFLYSYVRREAVLSSQIEGTQSSLSDLLLFELEEAPGAPRGEVVEVSNYVAALNHGMTRLREGFPLANRLLREIHGVLMSKGRDHDKLPGEFRRSQNWIGGTRPGNARFVPPPPQEVEGCMAALEPFLQAEVQPLPVLLRAALAHVQFETIHPFLDGNGRVGRLLIALLLQQGGLLTEPLLYLSLYFKEHRQQYYDLLDRVRLVGDWEAWVDFFLEGVEFTATRAVETARRIVKLFEADTGRIEQAGRGAASALRVFSALRRRPALNLPLLCRENGMTFPTASKAMQTLAAAGIIRELTGQRRNRVFVYDAYLKILNEGGEPL
jgi:Fic family protein